MGEKYCREPLYNSPIASLSTPLPSHTTITTTLPHSLPPFITQSPSLLASSPRHFITLLPTLFFFFISSSSFIDQHHQQMFDWELLKKGWGGEKRKKKHEEWVKMDKRKRWERWHEEWEEDSCRRYCVSTTVRYNTITEESCWKIVIIKKNGWEGEEPCHISFEGGKDPPLS